MRISARSIYFKAHRCFKDEWAGFSEFKPITIIIGRNNSGKSQLIDLVAVACKDSLKSSRLTLRCRGILEAESLQRHFDVNTSGGDLGGAHWNMHGRLFAGKDATWEFANGAVSAVEVPDVPAAAPHIDNARKRRLLNALENTAPPLAGKSFRRLLADRDIRTEPAANDLALESDGRGATNMVRRFITSSSLSLPRELVQRELLQALNEVFGEDGQFSEIQVQLHDEKSSEGSEGDWEIYLGEISKGLVALSRSGSGLKTVLLVLLNLLVVPHVEKKNPDEYVFALEELENNLHPALLRRLLRYIDGHARTRGSRFVLTTHSSAMIDCFSSSEHAMLVHVTHDGQSAKATTVSAHLDKLEVVAALGAKASDLLQSNGIIWVEGPSDRIYLNKWIEIQSQGELKEGRDYQCAFYGGSLLARYQFVSIEQEIAELANLFRLNPNFVIVCDSDRQKKGGRLKERVRRIRKEVEAVPSGHIWILEAKEIENYVPGETLAQACQRQSAPDPLQFEHMFPSTTNETSPSYFERLGRKSIDKVELALAVAPLMTAANMQLRFDWTVAIGKIVDRARRWNA